MGTVWSGYGNLFTVGIFLGNQCKQTIPVSGGRKPGHRGQLTNPGPSRG